MKVTVCYMAQLKQAAGLPVEEVALDRPCSALDFVRILADKHGDALQRMLLDDDGNLQPTILMFVNDAQVQPDNPAPLKDGDQITFLSPIAGG